MNIEESVVRKSTLSGDKALDPIHVFLEDCAKGEGKLTISNWDESWTCYWGSCYWGSMGGNLISFIERVNVSYLVNKLSDIKHTVIDTNNLVDDAKNTILTRRREREIDKDEAALSWCQLDTLWLDGDELLKDESLLCDIYGNEYWHCLPTKVNPEYEHLHSIVKVVKEGLLLLETKENASV